MVILNLSWGALLWGYGGCSPSYVQANLNQSGLIRCGPLGPWCDDYLYYSVSRYAMWVLGLGYSLCRTPLPPCAFLLSTGHSLPPLKFILVYNTALHFCWNLAVVYACIYYMFDFFCTWFLKNVFVLLVSLMSYVLLLLQCNAPCLVFCSAVF